MEQENTSEKPSRKFTTLSGIAPHAARKFAKYEFGAFLLKVKENQKEFRYDVFIVDKMDVAGKTTKVSAESIEYFKAFFERGTMNVIVIPAQYKELYSENE